MIYDYGILEYLYNYKIIICFYVLDLVISILNIYNLKFNKLMFTSVLYTSVEYNYI